MKRSVKYLTILISFLLLISSAICLHTSAETTSPSTQQQRMQELFELYGQYRTKEDNAGGSLHATSDLIWDEYLTPLSKLTGEDATNAELIDLIYHKGMAIAPLSWIYQSHADMHQNAYVNQVYQEQSVLILSKTAESDDLASFFEGSKDTAPKVYDCYTALLNAIYSEKLQALALTGDSPEVSRLLSDAVARLRVPDTIASDPNNPTPSFTVSEDEDAEKYQTYFAYVEKQVGQQRNRDLLKDQLAAVYRALYPSVSFTELSELTDNHEAVRSFLTDLPQTTTIVQMNSLLNDAVIRLLDELADGQADYTKTYLETVLKPEVNDAVALASGAIPTPRLVDLAASCFGEPYQLNRAIAQGKDKLVADAQAFGTLSDDQQAILLGIVEEYTEGKGSDPARLDACLTQEELAEELARAELRLEWFGQYPSMQKQIEAALDKYNSAALTDAQRNEILARAALQYELTDAAIRDGLREGAEPLAEDIAAMDQIVRDAEILSFRTKHPIVANPPATVTREHRAALAAAIADVATLSDAAKNEPSFNQQLLSLGENYKLAVQSEIDSLLSETEGTSDAHDALNELIRENADTLKQAVDALETTDENGNPALAKLLEDADRLADKAERIDDLLLFYEEEILANEPTDYVNTMHKVCADATAALQTAEEGAEEAIVTDTVAKLNRLHALEQIRQILEAHEHIPGAQALLEQAEAALLPDAENPPADLSSFQTELLSQLHGCVRADALSLLEQAYDELMKRRDDYSAQNLAKLNEIYTLAVADAQSRLLSDAAEDTEALFDVVEQAVADMRAVRLDRLSASASSEYAGSVEAENGFAVDTTLTISPSDGSPEEIAKQIQLAAKEDRIRPVGGTTLSEELQKSLKRCTVTAALDVRLHNALSANNRYNLSVLFSEGTDLSLVFGVIYICEDGSMEFYEISSEEQLIRFTTSHFSDYYLVSEKVVNLMPWIILLCILLACELIVLIVLYFRRNRKQQARAVYSLLFPTVALRVVYTPVGGMAVIGILSIAAVGLGVWIAALLLAERRATKKQQQAEATPLSEEPIAATIDCIEETPSVPVLEEPETANIARIEAKPEVPVLEESESANVARIKGKPNVPTLPVVPERAALTAPLPEVTAEDAEILMTDEEATEYQLTDYLDEERYSGSKRAQINLDTIAKYFQEGELVHLNSLKEKNLLPRNVGFVKILARGTLDKPLTVLAQDFSTAALKMILLTGGTPIVTHASPERSRKTKRS